MLNPQTVRVFSSKINTKYKVLLILLVSFPFNSRLSVLMIFHDSVESRIWADRRSEPHPKIWQRDERSIKFEFF